MIEQSSQRSANPDATLVDILSVRLGCDVSLIEDGKTNDTVVVAAMANREKSAIVTLPTGDCTIALRLPSGGVATWRSGATCAKQSASLGETVLELQSALSERNELRAETDALAAQVVHDFEELSLIRSLASAMELPSRGVGASELALKSLRPLAGGVGAVSIAAVFLSDNDEMGLPCWSGNAVTSSEVLHHLIQEHRDEAAVQPVVRNQYNGFDHLISADCLNEFVLVQCRSEGRLHGWLIACNRTEDAMQHVPWTQLGFTTVQASLLETATSQLAAQLHNMRLLRQKEELFTDVVRALVNAVDARDPYTCGHSERVALFSRCIGEVIGETPVGCQRIYLSGLLHDVGKIAIPDIVLQKPGQLNEEERAIIETHTEAGWRILHELEALRDVLPGVLYHHEHFDGSGYPDRLVGENIPLDGRILAVCDAFDAMTSSRPYRDGMAVEKAIVILRDGSGSYWDPMLIDVFIKNIDRINKIRWDHRPREQAIRPAPVDGKPDINPLPVSI